MNHALEFAVCNGFGLAVYEGMCVLNLTLKLLYWPLRKPL